MHDITFLKFSTCLGNKSNILQPFIVRLLPLKKNNLTYDFNAFKGVYIFIDPYPLTKVGEGTKLDSIMFLLYK